MKIPNIKGFRIRNSLHTTYRVGKVVLNKATQPIAVAKDNSKTFLAAATICSSLMIPNSINKLISKDSSLFNRGADRFERSVEKNTKSYLEKNTKAKLNTKKRTIKPRVATKFNPNISNTLHGNKITYKPINELNDTLNSLLVKVKHRRNPLHNKAHVFMEKAEKYNLNPIVLMGIALHESSRGSSLGALHKNNIGGIMGKKGLRKFNDIDACIEKMAEHISTVTKKYHLKTVQELSTSGKYCDKAAAKEWAKGVMFYVEKLS